MRKELVLIIIFSLVICQLFAQTDPKLSVFNFNPLHYNPAFAGSNGTFGIIAIHSSQFVGFDGAPRTNYLSAHGLLHQQKIGMGVDVMQDSFGPSNEIALNGNFSYFMQLSSDWQFSFGVKVGLDRFFLDYSQLNILDPDEEVFAKGDNTFLKPNLGMGFYLMNKSFYIGASTPTLTSRDLTGKFSTNLTPEKSNYYLTSGYNLSLNPNLLLRSAVLTRVVNGAPHSSLFSLAIDHLQNYFFGVNYETQSSIGALLGFNFDKNIKLGYALDHPTNGLGRYTKGTHTVFLSFVMEDSKRKRILPCFNY